MPTDTFLRLDPDKRDRFVHAALVEFARHPFDQASITAIVKELGIAKGSVYQYFEDKVDLFQWLVAQGVARRQAWMATLVPPDGLDRFDRLAFAYREGLRFWLAEPLWSRVMLRVREPSLEPRLEAQRKAQEAAVHAWIAGWLREGMQAGEVRADLDVDVTSHLVTGVLQDGLLRAFLAAVGTDLATLVEREHLLDAEQAAAVDDVTEATVAFLRRAVAP